MWKRFLARLLEPTSASTALTCGDTLRMCHFLSPSCDRYNKCMSCYNQLLSIRSFLLKRQTMQGKLGHLFREMHILMQGLE